MGDQPLIVSYGGGVNSAAMLVGMYERAILPDIILFADTGGEKPETYEYIRIMQQWLHVIGWPEIKIVSVADNPEAVSKSLEENCLKMGSLPSIAYGWKTCSQRWKADPITKYCNNNSLCKAAWALGLKVRHAIGYDFGESHRNLWDDKKTEWWYPLREWRWGRKECVEAVNRAGLPVPRKSSCFFCPSSKKQDILWLRREHPDLFARAVAIERGAAAADAKRLEHPSNIKGLGRRWSWESLVKADEAQFKMFHDSIETPCGCYDGEGEDHD